MDPQCLHHPKLPAIRVCSSCRQSFCRGCVLGFFQSEYCSVDCFYTFKAWEAQRAERDGAVPPRAREPVPFAELAEPQTPLDALIESIDLSHGNEPGPSLAAARAHSPASSLRPPPPAPATGEALAGPKVCVVHPGIHAVGRCERCQRLICALCAEERPRGFVCHQPCSGPHWTLKRRVAAQRKSMAGVLAAGAVAALAALWLVLRIVSPPATHRSGEPDNANGELSPTHPPRMRKLGYTPSEFVAKTESRIDKSGAALAQLLAQIDQVVEGAASKGQEVLNQLSPLPSGTVREELRSKFEEARRTLLDARRQCQAIRVEAPEQAQVSKRLRRIEECVASIDAGLSSLGPRPQD